VPEAAIPARKTTSPPGKTKPINNPVSIKIIPSTPINPRVETTEWASNKFILGVRVSALDRENERDLSTAYLFICKKGAGYA
jgi:hypothetical protein